MAVRPFGLPCNLGPMFVLRRYFTTFRFALVGAMLAGIVVALLLAASPELHKLVHHDGDPSLVFNK